jgi:hypothetical protein
MRFVYGDEVGDERATARESSRRHTHFQSLVLLLGEHVLLSREGSACCKAWGVRVPCAVCSPACETVVDNGRVTVSEGQQEKSGRSTQDSSTALAHSLTSAATSQSGFHLNIVVLTALVAFLMCSSAFCENICVTTSRYRVSGLWCKRLL